MKKLLTSVVMLAVSVVFSGCHDPYYQPWYTVYGNYCGKGTPRPGCNFYADGTKIRDHQDPFYRDRVLSFSLLWTYTDSYGYTQYYSGFAWQSQSGILYDSNGRALNDVFADDSHDLLGQAAELEAQAIEASGKHLAAKFADQTANALTEEQGIRIARTLNDWAVLGKQRPRTGGDAASFSQRLYGVKLEAAQAALMEAQAGRPRALQDLNRQVAAYWGTNPETAEAILSSWYSDVARTLR